MTARCCRMARRIRREGRWGWNSTGDAGRIAPFSGRFPSDLGSPPWIVGLTSSGPLLSNTYRGVLDMKLLHFKPSAVMTAAVTMLVSGWLALACASQSPLGPATPPEAGDVPGG